MGWYGLGMKYESGDFRFRPTVAGPGDQAGIVEFAERVLGWKLEDKQRELLAGPRRRVILNCTRQWGKSWMAAVTLLHHALGTPRSLSVVAGPTLRQSGELLRKVLELARRLGLDARGDGINRHSIVLPNGSRVVATPGNSPDGIRGFSGVTMLVVDEAAMVRDDLYVAVRPMLTQTDGSIWLLSTPKEEEGFFFREFTAGAEDWRRVVVRATECPRFKEDQLEAERSSMGERLFAREFLCEFVSANDGLIDAEWFEGALCEDVKPLGVDS